ncbi:MAG: hypothetical protein ACFUZC_20105 [Chthoniobacteraceae bacterium]
MKRILLCSLLSCSLLAACAPHKRTTVYRAPFPREETQVEVPPAPVAPDTTANMAPAPAPTATPTPAPKKRDVLYGVPEPGKPGFVRSPYNPQGGLLDCRGYPPGTEMKDEYAPGRTFLVP